VFLALAQALQNGTAKYQIKSTVCKALAIPQNFGDVTFEKVVSGQFLTRLVVGLVSNTAFNGSRRHNPFNFQHYNLLEITVYLDGQQQHVLQQIQPNYEGNLYICAYNSLFSGMSKLNRDEGNSISRDNYKDGYALYTFDLTTDLGEDDHFNLVKQGNVCLAMKFADALAETVTIIAFAEFDNIIELDRNCNVLVNFSV